MPLEQKCSVCGKDINEQYFATLKSVYIDDDECWGGGTYKTTLYYRFCGECYRKKIVAFLDIFGAHPTGITDKIHD